MNSRKEARQRSSLHAWGDIHHDPGHNAALCPGSIPATHAEQILWMGNQWVASQAH